MFLTLLLALEQEVDLRYEIVIFLIFKGKIELSFRLVELLLLLQKHHDYVRIPSLFCAFCRSSLSLLKWPTEEM